MSRIDIAPIQPTLKNAERVQVLVLQDLVHTLGLPEEEARKIADPGSDELVDGQLDSLERGVQTGEELAYLAYMGAWLDGSLDGVLKLSEWNRADDAPFSRGVGKVINRARTLVGNYHRPDRPLSIFQLSAEHALSPERRDQILTKLVRHAACEAREEQVRLLVSATDNDPAVPILLGHGFTSTRRTGAPIAGVQQTLYARDI